jgi:hypothetical protein
MVCWISPILVDKEFYGWWLRIVALVSRDIKGGQHFTNLGGMDFVEAPQ